MINKETIISVYDEKLTLLQWLKSVNKALDEAVLTNVEIEQRGNATFVFVFTFEDGTRVESNEIIVNQGESIVGATIQNGHLLLTLSNDDVLDAGNVKPISSFSIDASQHLIVHYGDGTTQDLGAIFQGNVNIVGTLDVTGGINASGSLTGSSVSANSIIENMTGYSFETKSVTNLTQEVVYAGVCKNGNKVTFVYFSKLTRTGAITSGGQLLANFSIPTALGEKLYPYNLSGAGNIIDIKKVSLYKNATTLIEASFTTSKPFNNLITIGFVNGALDSLEQDTTYVVRYEETFLLSDNLAS